MERTNALKRIASAVTGHTLAEPPERVALPCQMCGKHPRQRVVQPSQRGAKRAKVCSSCADRLLKQE